MSETEESSNRLPRRIAHLQGARRGLNVETCFRCPMLRLMGAARRADAAAMLLLVSESGTVRQQ